MQTVIPRAANLALLALAVAGCVTAGAPVPSGKSSGDLVSAYRVHGRQVHPGGSGHWTMTYEELDSAGYGARIESAFEARAASSPPAKLMSLEDMMKEAERRGEEKP